MKNSQALMYTKQLETLLLEIDDIYEKTRDSKEEHDFYKIIEPFVNHAIELSSKWREAIDVIIAERSTYFIGERQLDQIQDNISKLSVQAFHYMTSYKLFKSYLQSTKFLLTTIIRQLQR
ncbi:MULTISPECIES: DUF1798 family protein [Bacillus]|uniref:DUF1798 family protein n=1 Tax=Bacillus TaxID=1386 RepID=UPI0002F18DEA|nr:MULTISPECIES: DUF1798 family protein [Bacillus]